MKQLSSLDLHFLIKELKILENQRIDNFYMEKSTFYIKIYIHGKANTFLTYKTGKYLYLTEKKQESATPPNFIQYLRKHLKNSYIRKIEQTEGERIIQITINKKTEEKIQQFILILELFEPGNIILCDEKYKITNLLLKKTFKDRTLKVKEKYELPPKKELPLSEITTKKLQEITQNSDMEIVKLLAIKLGIGGKYSEEICALSQTDKNTPSKNLTQKQTEQISKQLNQIQKIPLAPQIVLNEKNEIENFIPFKFKTITKKQKEVPSFNEAVKNYFEQFTKKQDKKTLEIDNQITKLKNLLQKQIQQKKETEEKIKKLTKIGETIYENYTKIDEVIKASKNKEKKMIRI